MIILQERKLTYKSDIKDPKEVQVFFDMIKDAFFDIKGALYKLGIIFMDARWNLKEGQSDSLAVYSETAKEIRLKLTVISMMNTTLVKFLAKETGPIPLSLNAPGEIDKQTKGIKEELEDYYKKVKGTSFPKFNSEIKQHQDIVKVINGNIDRINEINSAYPGIQPVSHVINLLEIR
jgi:hypothetical protein